MTKTTTTATTWVPVHLLLSGSPQEAAWIDQISSAILYYVSPAIFLVLFFLIPSPYGKLETPLSRTVLGSFTLPARLSWCVFEMPNLIWAIAVVVMLASSPRHSITQQQQLLHQQLKAPNYILFGLFVIHYLRRALWYPWIIMSPRAKPVPLAVFLSAISYTTVNGYLQCQSLLVFQTLPDGWLHHGTFWFGLGIAIAGTVVNAQSDAALRRLRSLSSSKKNDKNQRNRGSSSSHEYQIPHGYWLFCYISCPHYLGEILLWLGYWLACNRSLVAASFVAFTAANLVPRAVQQHAWYRQTFGDAYPADRKAWIPFIW